MAWHIGILGGGNISQTHALAALEIDGARLVAVGGDNPTRVRRLAESVAAAAYDDDESFFAHRPMDVVLIGSPSGRHAEQGIRAARRGLHVLVEKPLAITSEEADALITACDEAGVKLGVFFQDRTAPDVRQLKRLVDGGRVGKLFLASARVRWYRPPEYYGDSRWRGTWALDGGGALMNQGIHTVDLLLWLMGDVRTVWAKATTALHDIEVEDTVVAALEFTSGAVATLEAATSAYPGYSRRLELTGSQGTVILENDRLVAADLRESFGEAVGGVPTALADERAVSATVSDASGHRRVIEDFRRAIATGGAPLCDGRQGRRSVELVRAIYRSSQTGEPVRLVSGD